MSTHRSAAAQAESADEPLASLQSELDRLCDAIARGLADMYRRRQAALLSFPSADRPDVPEAA
jgi:hypothetical protein